MTLIATSPDAAAFAPFGTIIDAPRNLGDRKMFSDWLRPVDGLALQFHINAIVPSAVPLTLTLIERHPHAAQAFVPMDVSRYVVTVAPSDADGAPDLTGLVCMELPGTLGVIYNPGVWHAGVTVLDRTAHFAVLMYRGAPDDDVICAIDPLTITVSQPQVQA
jgi:ureidoglycolate lyase